jgi:hypothetical protein
MLMARLGLILRKTANESKPFALAFMGFRPGEPEPIPMTSHPSLGSMLDRAPASL